MIVIILLMIASEGVIRHFYNLSLCLELSPTPRLKWPGRNRVQIICNTSCAYHIQHVVCHVVRMDSSAIKFDRV